MSYQTGSQGMSREMNRVAILRLIGASGPIARNEIARSLGLSPATVTSVTRELIERGLVRVANRAPSRGGRPAVLLELVGGAASAFGVKIAPDHLVGVRVDLDAEVLERFQAPLEVATPDGLERIGKLLREWTGSRSASPLLGVGLGVPGVVDTAGGLVTSPMLGWRELPLATVLQEHLDVPVLVDNDVNTLAVSERLYGRGRSVNDFITVTLGRGIGLGIIVGGDIYRGYGGGAGEFGHVTVVDDGPVCSCGKRGCLEALVSDPALLTQARRRKLIPRTAGIDALLERAAGADDDVLQLYANAGLLLGRSVAGLVNVLSPELVFVSGEGTQAWTFLSDSFERGFRAHVFPPLRDVKVEVDPWDDEKWAVGAAALVLRGTFTALADEGGRQSSTNAWVRAEPGAREVTA
jgi:predicted NBD/HSP70 family sugar kinase